MKLTFATASLSRQGAIESLLLEAFKPYVAKLGRDRSVGPLPWLEAAIKRRDVFVALDAAAVVGVIAISRPGDEMVIDHLAVAPSRQGTGIGSWLLGEIEQVARQERVTALTLQTSDMEPDLLRFYNRHGFCETHRALPEHGMDRHLRVHLSKRFDGPTD